MTSTIETISTKKGISLSSALSKAQDIQDKCHDFMVSSVCNRNCWYNGYSNSLSFTTDSGETVVCGFTPYALSQLCGKVGVHTAYLQKCLEQGFSDLAAENLNAWMDEYKKNLFIREYDGNIRGVLSDRYAVMDAPDVLDVCCDTFGTKDYVVRGMLVNPERLHMRVVQKNMLKVDGEDLFAGITIDSSDVGRSTLIVRFFIYKQVCTNGMCISEGFGDIYVQRHRGLTKKEFSTDLVANLGRVPELTEQVIEMIKCANGYDKSLIDFNKFNEDKQERFKSRIRALTRLPEDGVAKVIDTMYNNYSVSRWGFINSLTEVAQDYTLERRLELERVAGDILFHGNQLLVA